MKKLQNKISKFKIKEFLNFFLPQFLFLIFNL